MNKYLLSGLFSLFIALQHTQAKPIDAKTAEKRAFAFWGKTDENSNIAKRAYGPTLQLAYSCIDKQMVKAEGTVYYYVFNRGENEGFIIVSGDDRAKPVLGYSDTGNFNINTIPDNFRYWLDFYKEELKLIMSQEHYLAESSDNVQSKSYAIFVSPLLQNIKYGQNSPYNNLCPLIPRTKKRTATGCVATSMAQVMRYYQWPAKGKGKYSYTTRDLDIQLSADFDNTAYDWESMPGIYNSTSSPEQTNAIATLMLHTGISVDMNYNEPESGASVLKIPRALINYFDYDTSIEVNYRTYFTASQWTDLIKEELNNKRPVIYNGVSSSGSHSFVCDGYDSNGYFHINWGWEGTSDGYFEISTLTPNEQGTGGSLGGYNMNQCIISGIRPATGEQKPCKYQLKLTTGLSADQNEVAQGGTAIIRLGFRNYGVGSCYGYHGLGLYKADGTFVSVVYQSAFAHMEGDKIILDTLSTGTGSDKLQWKLPVKPELPTGSFRIHPVYHFGELGGNDEWEIISGEIGMPAYLNAEISSTGIVLSPPEKDMPQLSATGLKASGRLYQNKNGRFECSLKNSGVEYTGMIRIKIMDKNNENNSLIVGPEGVSLQNSETKNYEIKGVISLTPGEYQAVLQYDSKDGYMRQLGEAITIDVVETPTEAPDISIISLSTDLDVDKVDAINEIIFRATLKNKGGYAEVKACATIYYTNGNPAGNIGNQSIFLEKDEEREYIFKGFVTLEDGKYYVRILLMLEGKEWDAAKPLERNKLSFTLTNGGSDISKQEIRETTIYLSPQSTILYMDCVQIPDCINIFDLSGQLIKSEVACTDTKIALDISSLNPGVYLMQLKTGNGLMNRKFVKQ